ncbi:MAG: dehydrogenase [Bdellovibrionales bacterium GWC1_52_8]|nr:MAG: dehydrogenase [Bdellovibrionales bacterium GWB1_52_6]OFZ04596.1 MAG: dehydrogenase [Bdellovibrionales bacterium GWA1_52_35]OFZ32807.1 MAG: dehydrogenase [Bdellovibrionales bacterium GWC1_52_8]HCM40009.1 dehydrogenase [Bdellovibrionales bacterium]
MSGYKYIGKSTVRVDGKVKISGAAQYIDDLEFGPGLLFAEIVESPHAYARIKKIDCSKALKVEGVVKIVTGKEFPYRFGLYMHDRYIFAQDHVRFVGEQVGAVIARTPEIAKRASKLVRVDYEVLEPVLDVVTALLDNAPLIHPELGKYQHVPWFFPEKNTNIAHFRKVRKGNMNEGFKEADYIFEDTYTVPRYAHCSIETHGAVGLFDHSRRLTVWAASQSPHTQRHLFAEALAPLGIKHKDVRVIAPHVGGGFGGKAGVSMEILAASLATAVQGSPVKVLWSRAQEFYNTYQRQGVVAKMRFGVKNDGTITALEQKLYWDAGAYVEYGANVVNAAGLSATGPYRIPNVYIDSVCVYTNLPPGGPYRGFGYSEFLFGLESHMNEIAKKLKLDPVDFRRKNAICEGDTLNYGGKMNPSGLLECIDKVAKEIEWGKKRVSKDPRKAIGKGFALFWKAPAMPPNAASSAFLKFNEDASLNILVSAMEIGQGFLTVMAQIAGEVLGIPPEKIRVETPDTDRNPYEWQTVASHITWSTGNAVKKAAMDAREQIFDIASRALGKDRNSFYLEDETLKSRTEPEFALSLKNFVINGIMMKDGTFRGGPIIGRGMFMPEFASAISDPQTSQGGKPNVHYTVGASAIEIEIDRETGKITIPKVVLGVDCGKVLNPDLLRGQVTGGMLQGLATVLYEEMRFDSKGKLLNANFTDYKIPTAMDVPDEIVSIFVEHEQPDGPFGARGVGEHTMIPAAPIIANAIEDALGIRIKSMPITAEKIALALKGLDLPQASRAEPPVCFQKTST